MKAQDLRIKNWMLDNENRVCRVTEITLNEFKAPSIEGAITALPNKPMPITEKWLLRFGFVQHPKLTQYYFLNEFRFNINTFTVRILRSCDKEGEGQKHACGYPIITDMISCGYVHQLQNLFFAITGKEL